MDDYYIIRIYDRFILLQLNPFGFRADREGWWLEHSVMVAGLLVSRGC